MSFGIIQRKSVSENIWDYSIGILGESGIGKTTICIETCEKLVGPYGYAIANMGKEQGVDCIEGANFIDVPDYKTWSAMCKELIKNKDTDYKDLKILVIDTLDQCIEIFEPEVIRLWNAENMGKKDFTPAKTMNAAWTGFGKAEDKLIQLVLNDIWKLKKVGITCWFTMHTKTREILDPLTNNTYTVLSTNMMQKYFNGFKTKIHVCGIACVDRTIEVEKTGRKNVVTKKDITINKVTQSRRKIIFRDDNYGVDSKSRFAGIVNEINLDSDEFIKAIQDAIQAEKSKANKTETKSKSLHKNKDIVLNDDKSLESEVAAASDMLPKSFEDNNIVDDDEDMFEFNDEEEKENLKAKIQTIILNKSGDDKKVANKIIKKYIPKDENGKQNIKNCNLEQLKMIYEELGK